MPRGGDQAQISVINQQFTAKADEIVYQTRRMIAPGYIDDGTKTYHEGDIVEYENVDYVCTGTKSGAWDSSKWDTTDMATQIQEAKESGGTNVEANPDEAATADLHKLKVENTVYGIPDPTVTKTATGNPIEISDGADAPLVKCVTQITGSQDLHGYDKPWVGGAGKNKAFIDSERLVSNDHCSIVYNSNNGCTITGDGSNYTRVRFNIPVVVGQTYTLSWNGYSDGSYRRIVGIKDYTNTDWGASNYYAFVAMTETDSSYTITFTAENANFAIGLYISTNSLQTASLTVSKMQLELGSTATAYTPYSNICPITAYTEGEIEVRGKNVADVSSFSSSTIDGISYTNNGNGTISMSGLSTSASWRVLTTFKAYANHTYILSGCPTNGGTYHLTVSGNGLDWRDIIDKGEGATFTAPITGIYNLVFRISNTNISISGLLKPMVRLAQGTDSTFEPYVNTTHTTTYPSAIYRGSEDCVKGEVTSEWAVIASYAGETLPGEWISDRDEYVPGTTPTTGAQVAYELATPTTSSVTPTNLPIKSLAGYSHIESTTGEMEVEYITQTYQPIVDLIDEAADTKHAYSTTEHVVGKWIDGSDVYERTVHLDSLSSSPLDWETLFQESVGVIVSVTGCFLRTTGELCDIGSTSFRVCYNPTIHQGYVCYYYTEGNISEFTITVRYTKTSSNRSLSKGATDSLKADLSEVKDEGEESVDKVDKVDEPTETIEEKEENAGESNSENER